MEEFILNAINKHFRTLSLTGSINSIDKQKLFIVSSIYSIYKSFRKFVNKEDAVKFTKYVECLAKRNCLFGKSVPCFQPFDSLVTIVDNDVIVDNEDIILVSADRKTKKLTDFTVKTDIELDQYIVGYDVSDNNEIAINVNDLGVFWDVDI